jgi:hypothetical protein
MAKKRGLSYQDLVAKVEAALDPHVKVAAGEWIDGPDGRRDCDVSIRGTHEGAPYFVLIECKDWRKRVGIDVVDALDSKRKDLGVDLAMIYSNSGFTGPAVRKADRVGINLLTAVASSDSLSRARAKMLAYGRLLDVTNLSEGLIEPPGQDLPAPPGLTIENMLYEGKPVHNWLVAQVYQELSRNEDKFEGERYALTLEYTFGSLVTLDMAGVPFPAVGVAVTADVEVKWMSKALSIDVDFARFDLKSGRLTIPPSTPFTLGPLDDAGWEPSEPPHRDLRREPGRPEFHVHAKLRRQLDVAGGGIAELDSIVTDKAVTLEQWSDQ